MVHHQNENPKPGSLSDDDPQFRHFARSPRSLHSETPTHQQRQSKEGDRLEKFENQIGRLAVLENVTKPIGSPATLALFFKPTVRKFLQRVTGERSPRNEQQQTNFA